MPPHVAYVLLRNSHFGPQGASAVELCVRELARASRYAASTIVACPRVAGVFADVATLPIDPVGFGGNLAKAAKVARTLKARGADLLIVENHLPAAAAIAAVSGLPVVLHSHAYVRPPRGRFDAALRRFEFRRLAAAVFVSDDCARRFEEDFPALGVATAVVPNGLDLQAWATTTPKSAEILVVGRALSHKGHAEAMAAIAAALATRRGWRARFILSVTDREPALVRALEAAAAASGGRVRIETNRPYPAVQAAWEGASIGLVLTTSPEPFGRTALEALASGAALITSGLGGLAEVAGDCAEVVDPVATGAVAAALGRLMDEPERRLDLARRGRARAEALYDLRAVAARMDAVIDRALTRRG